MNIDNQILGSLLRNPLESKSMRQLALDTSLTYVTVHRHIPSLLKRNLIRADKKGKSHLISINLENASTQQLSSAILYERRNFLKKYPKISLLVRDIEKASCEYLYVLILFGSYAQEKPQKNSDADLLFIIQDQKDINTFKKKVETSTKLSTLSVDLTLVTMSDFVQMLEQKHSVGREAFEKGIVLFGTESYYVMVKEHARKRGY